MIALPAMQRAPCSKSPKSQSPTTLAKKTSRAPGPLQEEKDKKDKKDKKDDKDKKDKKDKKEEAPGSRHYVSLFRDFFGFLAVSGDQSFSVEMFEGLWMFRVQGLEVANRVWGLGCLGPYTPLWVQGTTPSLNVFVVRACYWDLSVCLGAVPGFSLS